MAKIQYSALVNSMSGKLNGSVLAFNKGGSYVRNKGIVANPNTVAQQNVRGRFGQASSSFKSLTVDEVNSWNALAASSTYTNVFGEAKSLSGLQWFVRLNTNLAQIGQPSLTTAPLLVSELDIYNVNAGYDAILDGLSIAVSTTVNPAGWSAVVSATPQTRNSISNVSNTYRLLPNPTETTTGTAPYVTLATNTIAEYNTVFSPPVEDGGDMYVKIKYINNTTGQSTQVFGARILIAF